MIADINKNTVNLKLPSCEKHLTKQQLYFAMKNDNMEILPSFNNTWELYEDMKRYYQHATKDIQYHQMLMFINN